MAPEVPILVSALLASSTVLVPLALLAMLRQAAVRAGLGRDERRSLMGGVGIAVGGWLFLSWWFGGAGVYKATPESALPWILPAILTPLATGVVAMARVASLRRTLQDPTLQRQLVGIQVYRSLGVTFLLLLLQGDLPAVFAAPAGTGDLLIGIAALPVAYLMRWPLGRPIAIAWNLLGILDLVVAVTTAFLAAPGRLQVFTGGPSSYLMTVLPLVLIAAFMVPLSLLLHIASLRSLRRRREERLVQASQPA